MAFLMIQKNGPFITACDFPNFLQATPNVALSRLSMGMSGDFDRCSEGATWVRIGQNYGSRNIH
jgi:uncharacterized pyridoxal phosphate-containing UPF0001 family protein